MLLTALLGACEREDRPLRSEPLLNESREQIALSTNSPGPGTPIEYKTGTRGEYEKNAFHVSLRARSYTLGTIAAVAMRTAAAGRARANGRRLDLRQLGRKHRRQHPRGSSKRHADFPRQNS